MNTTTNATSELLASNQQLIQDASSYLVSQGKQLNFSEWVTMKEYAKRHELDSISVLSNWINRGIIPAEDIQVIEELNGLKLIRDKIYK